MNLFNIRAVKILDQHPRQRDYKLHTHTGFEIFCFLAGDAMYNIEGNMYPLFPGDIVLLKNSEAHHVILNSAIPYERITIHFQCNDDMPPELVETLLTPVINRPIGQYNLYSYKDFQDTNWRHYLECLCKESDHIRRQIYLMTLLLEITDAFPLIQDQHIINKTHSLLQITHYIDQHLSDPLSIDFLCNHFFISETQLSRQFKKHLNTTVSEYILSKRLLQAYNTISKGVRPSSAYLQCGFRDYSSFYRAYKKKFGHSPKDHPTDSALLERIEFP